MANRRTANISITNNGQNSITVHKGGANVLGPGQSGTYSVEVDDRAKATQNLRVSGTSNITVDWTGDASSVSIQNNQISQGSPWTGDISVETQITVTY